MSGPARVACLEKEKKLKKSNPKKATQGLETKQVCGAGVGAPKAGAFSEKGVSSSVSGGGTKNRGGTHPNLGH